ncbi:MAG: acyl-ACP--UDP-N-acetylglucosamine O-acyltransferase [Bacteroidetes bacterium]|nr:acyl-ACP--UDP-N-acetylglucosamine O-acyltransferase [Bacteroidota bacterium]
MKNVEIGSKAVIGNNFHAGSFTVIEDDVVIGDNVSVGNNVYIANGARIADGVKIYSSAQISIEPHDLGYKGEPTTCEIGEGTVIKELATLCRGTVGKNGSRSKSVVGKNCYIMNFSHVAHDNIIGDNVIMTNSANCGGHVVLGKHVNIGALTGIHQFVHVGDYCMVGTCIKVVKDVPPYIMVSREPSRFIGLNKVGLKRKGFSAEQIENISRAYDFIYGTEYNVSDAVEKIKSELELTEEVNNILNFISNSKRGIIR